MSKTLITRAYNFTFRSEAERAPKLYFHVSSFRSVFDETYASMPFTFPQNIVPEHATLCVRTIFLAFFRKLAHRAQIFLSLSLVLAHTVKYLVPGTVEKLSARLSTTLEHFQQNLYWSFSELNSKISEARKSHFSWGSDSDIELAILPNFCTALSKLRTFWKKVTISVFRNSG